MSQNHVGSERESTINKPPRTPLWVKVFGITVIVLVLLFVVLHLTGNSFGPGSHMPAVQHSPR